MPAAARTVRHVRLRGPSERAVRRTVGALEDALRTATLPDAGGRVLLVRRLALGRVRANASPATLALAIERALAGTEIEWRHGADPAAGSAAVVWFRDRLDAHLALARRVLAGPPPGEWYWAPAVPRCRPGAERGRALREIAHSLAELPEAPAALPRWFAALVAGGHGDALAGAFRAEDVAPLARAARVRVGSVATTPVIEDPRDDAGSGPRSGQALHPRGVVRPPSDARVGRAVGRFIDAMLGAAGTSRRRARELAADRVAAGPSPGATSIETPSTRPLADAPRLPRGSAASARGATAPGRSPPWRGEAPPNSAPLDGRGVGSEEGVRTLGPRDRAFVPAPVTVPASDPLWQPTAAGGLLFLISVFARAGYAEWIADQPAWERHDVARRVLAGVLERLEVSDDDPIWEVVASAAPPAEPPRRFVAPLLWRQGLLSGRGPLRLTGGRGEGRLHDASGRLLLGGWSGPRPRALLADCRRASPSSRPPRALDVEVVEAWDLGLRRWLRRRTGLGIAGLVLRPAALAASPTHVEVRFDLGDADLRVRRAGLDLDPGWLPWLGRVVSFHYEPGARP